MIHESVNEFFGSKEFKRKGTENKN